MAAAQNAAAFTIVISALDKASAVFRGVGKNINALQSPFQNVSRSLAGLAEASGVNKLADAAGHAGEKFSLLGERIGGLLGPIAALGAAATAGGLLEISKSAAEWGHNLAISAARTGVAADQLAKLRYAASTVEVDTGTLDNALEMLNLTLGQTGAGGNKKAASAFKALGINIKDVHGHVKNAAAIFPLLSDAFAANADETEKDNVAQILFRKGWKELGPLLSMGARGQAELGREFEKYHGKVTPQFLKDATASAEGYRHLTEATSGLKIAIGAQLFPALASLIAPLSNWVASHRQLIAQNVRGYVEGIANSLKKVDWEGIGHTIMGIARGFAAVGRFLGPLGTTIAVTGVLFSPFISAALGAVGALGKFALVLGRVSLGIVGFLAEGVLGGFGPALGKLALKVGVLASESFPLLGDAIVAVGAALEATPIGWIVTGIAAVAGGAFLLYKNWGRIGPFFSGIWNKIGTGAQWAKNFAIGVWDEALPELRAGWDALPGFFQGVWSSASGAFKWGWDNLAPYIPGLNLVKLIYDAWSPITAFFKRLWDSVSAVFNAAWGALKPIIDTVVGGAKWLAEHTGLLDAAHTVAHVTTTIVHETRNLAVAGGGIVSRAAQRAALNFQQTEERGEAISHLGKIGALANLIARGEGGYSSVNLGKRGGYRAETRDLASMSLNQVMAAQADHQFNAVGRYQFIRSTLRGLVKSMHLTGQEKFDSTLQDRLFAQKVANIPAASNFLLGKSSNPAAAALGISKEWASVANPFTGKSYYAGTANNRASISSEEIISALRSARVDMSQPIIADRGNLNRRGSTDGTVTVIVRHENAPTGTRISTRTSGRNPPLLNTGRSFQPA